jgi:O-antigen/teichoic acid export membrane protein
MDIRLKVLTALSWTATARFISQLFSWIITIVVIRLLSPSDYGLMAMAVFSLSFLYLLNTFGLDAVLVQKRDLDAITRRQVFGILIFLNMFFFFLLFLAAVPIAKFFSEPRLVAMIRVLSFQFVILIFETLPRSQLEREIDFKKMSIVDLITMMLGSLITLILAFAGFGVWALVGGSLATVTTRTVGLNFIAPCWCWPSFSLRGMRQSMSFGGFATVDRGLWFLFSETDKFIGGKLLGKDLLGFYAVASHLASLPITKVAGLINAVAFPAFAKVQDDLEKAGSYLLKAVRVMSIVVFPVFLGMSSVAPEMVELFLGDKWQDASLPLQILSLVMPLRMVSILLPPLLWGIGRPQVSATNYLIAALVMPAAFYVGAGWGPAGLAFAWLSAYPVVFLVSVIRAMRVIKLAAKSFIVAMVRPALASVGMYGAVMAAKAYPVMEMSIIAEFVLLVVLGALAYTALTMLVNRAGIHEAWELFGRRRQQA